MQPETRYRFYRCDSPEVAARDGEALRADLAGTVWRPSMPRKRQLHQTDSQLTWLTPLGLRPSAFKVWWLFHQLRIFSSRDYCVVVIYSGERLVHYSGVFPRYFRFPFMNSRDLQIGDTWTDPDFRGLGLAGWAIKTALRACAAPGRSFWYVVEESNAPSIRVIEKARFGLVGTGQRVSRFGIRALGCYLMETTPGTLNSTS